MFSTPFTTVNSYIQLMGKKDLKVLSWDDFQSLGNPENVESPEDKCDEVKASYDEVIRIYLEKKGRRGKSVTIIKGLRLDEELAAVAKELKKSCGVGGSVVDGEIVLQGDQRSKAEEHLRLKGYRNVKKAGS